MKKRNLTFKFSLMFAAFTLLTLIICSLLSYLRQNRLYKSQREESIQYVANYLHSRILADGLDFLDFQKYFLLHSDELKIDPKFTQKNVDEDREIYEKLFAKAYPGKTLDFDIKFDDLPEEIKAAYAKYNYEYYALMFQEAVKSFNIAYTYYLVPSEKAEHMNWVILSLRETVQKDGMDCLLVNECISNPRSVYPLMWEAWDSGKRPSGYHVYDNQYGHTYAYYTPLFINGQKLGIIGVEVEVEKVNREILVATFNQMIVIGSALVIFMFFLLLLIRHTFIRKLVKLRNVIELYSEKKEPKIAESLIEEVTDDDEISMIMAKFADMIYQIELYVCNLSRTKQILQDTRLQAIELNELAIKDILTDVRNRIGYDKEVQKLEWELAEGFKELGVAVIDLNDLQKINETYGREKGDAAIIMLCKLVCRIFEHSPVFRVENDKFVVILKGHDLENIEDLIMDLRRDLKELQDNPNIDSWKKLAAAIGYSVYNPELDMSYDSLFKRAESEMYKNKKEMKAIRE